MFADIGYEETETEGLGWISGKVSKIDNQNGKFKLPHIGWNEINIENKIILNVPNNFIFIEGDSKSEFIEPIIDFLGNDVKTYLIGTQDSVNFTKLYQDNPDELFENIMVKMEKKK